MNRIIKIIIVFICLISNETKADSWIDPSWKKMLDDSDIIALITYKSDGEYYASAKINKLYKGKTNLNEDIFISGFSNKYGPIDKVKIGDQYLVFLKLNKPDSDDFKYWEESLKKEPELKNYFEAYKNNRTFYVWSPTSGDLKVEKNSIQYDLTQSSFYKSQKFFPFENFEEFLLAYFNKKNKDKLCLNYIKKLYNNNDDDDLATQILMKLCLLNYQKYDNVFFSFLKNNSISCRYALTKLLGNIKTNQSRDLLFLLLKDEISLIQGEAVRQLKKEPAEIVGPKLLENLNYSSEINYGQNNIMNPVMNTISGGKYEIIISLGELKYKPAIPDLLSLLDTNNEDIFNLVINSLKNIGTNEYIKYLQKHLDNKSENLIYSITNIIEEEKLIECLPNLKNYLTFCDRNSDPSQDYIISTIGELDNNSETKLFLLNDFEKHIKIKDTSYNNNQREWTNSYIRTFTDLKISNAKSLIYKTIFDWCGINEDFAVNKNLFEIKQKLESDFKNNFNIDIIKNQYKLKNVIAFIQNTKEVLNGSIPKVKYLIELKVPFKSNLNVDFNKIIKELNLPNTKISFIYNDNVYHILQEERFYKNNTTPLHEFIKYAIVFPNQLELNLFKNILECNFQDGRYNEELKTSIIEINSKL